MAVYSNYAYVIRQRISYLVDDMIGGRTYTPSSAGTTSTIVCTSLLEPDDFYNGMTAQIYSGTNVNEFREITDWDLATYTLTLAPVFTAETATSSLFEIHQIFTPSEYLNAINMAIESAADREFFIPIIDVTVALEDGTQEYSLPTNMFAVEQITEETEADGDEYKEAKVIDPRDYRVIKAYPPILKFDEARYPIGSGRDEKDIRIEGYGVQDIVSSDANTIALPTDWLVWKAITCLPYSKILSNNLLNTFNMALRMSEKGVSALPSSKSKWSIE